MSIDMVVDPNKLHFDRSNGPHARLLKLLGTIVVLAFISLFVWGGMTLSNPDTLPIKQVRIHS